jgi:hypothetical protein
MKIKKETGNESINEEPIKILKTSHREINVLPAKKKSTKQDEKDFYAFLAKLEIGKWYKNRFKINFENW